MGRRRSEQQEDGAPRPERSWFKKRSTAWADLLFIPGDMWPEFTLKFGMNGWWYTAKEEVLRRQCNTCVEWRPWLDFTSTKFSCKTHATCKKGQTPGKTLGEKNKRRPHGPSDARTLPKRKCKKMEKGEYASLKSQDSQEDEAPISVTAQHDIIFSAADPRYIGQPDNANGRNIILTVKRNATNP